MCKILEHKIYRYKHKNKYLTVQQCNNIFKSANNCFNNGYPLNRHFILLLERFGFDNNKNNVAKFKNDFFHKINKWLKNKNVSVAYTWVFEYGEVKGLHLHFLIYIPSGLQTPFKSYIKKILKDYGINTTEYKKPKAKALKTTYINYGYNNKDLTNLNRVCSYLVKGGNPKDNINDLYGEVVQGKRHQGYLPFQRVGHSALLYKDIRKDDNTIITPRTPQPKRDTEKNNPQVNTQVNTQITF